jgi:hypothetical protein
MKYIKHSEMVEKGQNRFSLTVSSSYLEFGIIDGEAVYAPHFDYVGSYTHNLPTQETIYAALVTKLTERWKEIRGMQLVVSAMDKDMLYRQAVPTPEPAVEPASVPAKVVPIRQAVEITPSATTPSQADLDRIATYNAYANARATALEGQDAWD